MALFGFERETWLDLTVNFIPMGMILFFIVGYALLPAFGWDPVFSTLQFSIMGAMFVSMVVLSYYAGKAIQGEDVATEEGIGEE